MSQKNYSPPHREEVSEQGAAPQPSKD